ncbi:MAG: carboxyl-terminal processing protease [Acidobacteriota bacterium]|nr:carboxyl-terminal processing protease [Acidobacteriota bacterium]
MIERQKQIGFGWIALVIVLFTGAITGGVMTRRARHIADVSQDSSLPAAERQIESDYDEALSTVDENYADDIDYEKASQASIQGMLSTLDPHSTFFTKADFDRLKQDHEAEFYGVGVSILRHTDAVYVQSVVAGTPADKAGLRYGDKIVEVDGKDAREWTGDQVSKSVRGVRGEPVTIKIERAGAQAPLYFQIVRDSVPQPTVRAAYMIRPGTAYVALTGGFASETSDEIEKALTDMQKQGMTQLVLDLRNNPGGLLPQAIKVAGQFLPRGYPIVSVRGRTENAQTLVYKNTEFDGAQDFPLVVLVNRNTASASEIVAGALQDHGRGLIVGETSFGKGLVQHLFTLPYGDGLTLTTQKYFTPYGRSIQRDYSSGSLYDYYVRHDPTDEPAPAAPRSPTLPSSPNTHDLASQPTPQPTPSPKPAGPAVRTAAGRVFYGGGGITPDIEVKPLDVATPVRARIFEVAFHFTRQLAAGQIAGLENYRVDKVLYGQHPRATDYPVTDRVLEAFREFVRKDVGTFGITPAQIDADADYARLRIRDEIVTAAYGVEAGSRTLLDADPQLLKALESLPDARRLAEMVRASSAS